MGHEISGTIVAFGQSSSPASFNGLSIGQSVVSPFIMPCGYCYYCVKGLEDLCETFFAFNRGKGQLYDGNTRLYTTNNEPIAMYSMGGLAEYCVVPSTAVFALPKNLPLLQSSILGCAVFTAYGAVKNGGDVRLGDNIAVIGAGGVGSNCLNIAKALGSPIRIAVDVSNEKLTAVKSLGATHTINASVENVESRIKEITGGRGVDVAIECLGKPKTFFQTINAVRDGGKAVMVGIAPIGVMAEVEITKIVRRQIKIIGSYGARARTDMPALLSLYENGLLTPENSISRIVSLEQADSIYKALDRGEIVGRAIVDMTL